MYILLLHHFIKISHGHYLGWARSIYTCSFALQLATLARIHYLFCTCTFNAGSPVKHPFWYSKYISFSRCFFIDLLNTMHNGLTELRLHMIEKHPGYTCYYVPRILFYHMQAQPSKSILHSIEQVNKKRLLNNLHSITFTNQQEQDSLIVKSIFQNKFLFQLSVFHLIHYSSLQ